MNIKMKMIMKKLHLNFIGIGDMKGLKLPDETEVKGEKLQMYLENNLNKIKNDISDDDYYKYQGFFNYIANKEKENIKYRILSDKVGDINFNGTII